MDFGRGVSQRRALRDVVSSAYNAQDDGEGLLWYCLPFFINPGYEALQLDEERNSSTGKCESVIGGSALCQAVRDGSSCSGTLKADRSVEAQLPFLNDSITPEYNSMDWTYDSGTFSSHDGGHEWQHFLNALAGSSTDVPETSVTEQQNRDWLNVPWRLDQNAHPASFSPTTGSPQQSEMMRSVVLPLASPLDNSYADSTYSPARRPARGRRPSRSRRQPGNGRRGVSRPAPGLTGVTMRLRTLLRKLLAGSGWIMDSSINKNIAKHLIRELIGDQLLARLSYRFRLLLDLAFQAPEERHVHIEALLPMIISIHTGENITEQQVDNFIRRDKGPYHLTDAFIAILGQKAWPPCLPDEAELRRWGCYREGEAHGI